MPQMKMDVLKNEHTNEHYMKLSISSDKRKGIWSEYIVPMDKYTNQRDFLKEAGIAAGALAEHQNETYGDTHDPADFVKEAVQQASSLLNNPEVIRRDYDKELG